MVSHSRMVWVPQTTMVPEARISLVPETRTKEVLETRTRMVSETKTIMMPATAVRMVEQTYTVMVPQTSSVMVPDTRTRMVQKKQTRMVQQTQTKMVQQTQTRMVQQTRTRMVQQARYRLVNNPVPAYWINARNSYSYSGGQWILANRAYLLSIGYSPAAIGGHPYVKYYHTVNAMLARNWGQRLELYYVTVPQTYTVSVPETYTVMVPQTYTVMVPETYTAMVEETYTVMVTQTTTVMVPETRTRMVPQTYSTEIPQTINITYPETYTVMVSSTPYTVMVEQTTTVMVPQTSYVEQQIGYTAPALLARVAVNLNAVCWQVGKLRTAKVTVSGNGIPVPQSRNSEFDYYANGLLQNEWIEKGNGRLELRTFYDYDPFGNREITQVSGFNAPSRTTTVTFDREGLFPDNTVNALGHIERYSWDARFGKKVNLIGPNGGTTRWQYDGFGRTIREDRADTTWSTTDFVNWPNYVTSRSSGQPAVTVFYDKRGRVVKQQSASFDGSPVYTEKSYDRLGRLSREYLPHTGVRGGFTSHHYDAAGRKYRIVDPANHATTIAYDGLKVTTTNANGQATVTTKNSQGKVVSVIDAMRNEMTYTYDGFGNLRTTTDATGRNITRMEYDIRGRKTSMNDPDMGAWSYEYDALGNLIKQTDAKAQVTTMTYDLLGRMSSRVEGLVRSSWRYDHTDKFGNHIVGLAGKWIGALSYESNM